MNKKITTIFVFILLILFPLASAAEITTKSYIYAGSLIASKSSDNPGETQFYIQDHLASNRQVVENSLETQSNDFYAFGEDKKSSGNSNNNYNNNHPKPKSNLLNHILPPSQLNFLT